MASQDLIIGCFTNYDWTKIKYWVNSVNRSGFVGRKVMIVYNADYATVHELTENQFDIYAFVRDDQARAFRYPHQFTIVVQRFYHMWEYLNSLPLDQYRYVITTDVKDVVFQSNPVDWLSSNIDDKKICVSSESIHYRNEPWGNDNMANSFPMIHGFMADKPIWNCGVLAGEVKTMKDLFLNIFLVSLGNPVYNPDQAALNVLLNLEPYRSITRFVSSEEGWACQAGTTADLSKNLGPFLTEPRPILKDDTVVTSLGTP